MSKRSNAVLFFGSIIALAFAGDTRTEAASCIPGFDYAIFAKNTLDFQGNAGTDSWNSATGTYAATAACTDAAVGINGTSAGGLYVKSNAAVICGNAQIGAGGNTATVITGNGNINGTKSAQSSNVVLGNVTAPVLTAAVPFNVSTNNANTTLTPNKSYGTVSCKQGSMTLSAGTYVATSLTLTSNCSLIVNSGPVLFYFTGSIDLQAGVITNNSGKPANLQFYGTSTATTVAFQGGAGAYATIYAPTASCTLQGNADVYGAMVCASAHVQGNAHIHFDVALRNLTNPAFTCPVSTPTEISRSNPIVATISNSSAVVQGTFESPTTTAKTIVTTADVAAYAFPYIKGHMRARTASSITTTASSFSSGTVLFDAGATGKIPAVNNTSCSTFNGTCRHLFTITATPAAGASTLFHPTMVDFKDANASTLGAIIAPSATVVGITAANWLTIERAILAGTLGGVDRSTAAVIGASSVAGNALRPTIAYFGADDGMLHAACASTGGTTASGSNICPALGTELWAFAPREELSLMRMNTQRIDGSPHVLDVFGDFNNPATGVRTWHTILMFSTGYAGTSSAATYALDVTDPANPSIVWEYKTPSTTASLDFGTGMTISSGQVTIVGAPTYLAFVETNNGGSGGAGVVTTAINVVTGQKQWAFTFAYPSPPRSISADNPLPATGVPGGAAAVDLTGGGFVTDVVFGDLYGDVWRVNAATGVSQNGTTTPLFRFTGNKHPIGVVPTVYSNGGQQYAFFTSGGYVDPTAASWSVATQYVIGLKLKATTVPVTESSTKCGTCDLVISSTLTSGDKGFSQAVVVGTQLFVTSDSTDVNSSTFGTGGNTGHMVAVDLAGQSVGATVAIAAGASAVAHSGTTLYTSSAQSQQQLSTAATTVTGPATEITGTQIFKRQLWLRTK